MVVATPLVADAEAVGLPDEPRSDERMRMRTLEEDRTIFLATGRAPAGVRPEIAASWRRSLLCGVSPVDAVPRFDSAMTFDCQVMRAARPVLEEREPTLAQTNVAIILTDAESRVLGRWGGDAPLERTLTALQVLPGHCFAESVVGTNSAALAVETGQPAVVYGAEHLVASFIGCTSAGAPIRHPMTRRVLGTVNVACRSDDATGLLMPWLLEMVREIESRMRVEGSVKEQLLLQAYVTARRDTRHPVVCLNEQTILTNAAAARLLGNVDQALLWEKASRAISDRTDAVSTLTLSSGRHVSARCEPIFDGSAAVGAKIELQVDEARPPRRAARRRTADASVQLGSLAGHGKRWQRLYAEVAAAKAADRHLLLVGEPGTGKLSILRALYEGERVDVMDAALHHLEEPGDWVRQLNARLEGPEGIVVLQHLEALDASTARTVSSLVARVGEDGPRVAGTVSSGSGSPSLHSAPLEAFGAIVDVPALRDRVEDLRDLVAALSVRHGRGDGTWSWLPDAIQTLTRVQWPSNIRSLEFVVKQVVAGRAPSYVDARSLPASIRGAASRRQLSRLEQLEAGAIAEALQQSSGNKLETAQRLGIARSTLYRRMRALGLDLTEANF